MIILLICFRFIKMNKIPYECNVELGYAGKTDAGGRNIANRYVTYRCHLGYNNHSYDGSDSPIDWCMFKDGKPVTFSFYAPPDLFNLITGDILYSRLNNGISYDDLDSLKNVSEISNDKQDLLNSLVDFIKKSYMAAVSTGFPKYFNYDIDPNNPNVPHVRVY